MSLLLKDLEEMLGTKEEFEKITKESLLEENIALDKRLKELREEEQKKQKQLRVALDDLNKVQADIESVDKEFDESCFKLQELNKK